MKLRRSHISAKAADVTNIVNTKQSGVNLKKKVWGGGARLPWPRSGLLLADGVCEASLRAGPGGARPPNEFWCIFTVNLSLQVNALAILMIDF